MEESSPQRACPDLPVFIELNRLVQLIRHPRSLWPYVSYPRCYADPAKALERLSAIKGPMDEAEYRSRCRCIVYEGPNTWTKRILTETQLKQYNTFRKRQQGRRRSQRLRAGPRDSYTLKDLYNRDNGQCAHCLGPVPALGSVRQRDPRKASTDHLTEVSSDGTNTLDNIALAHNYCNNDRSNDGRQATPEQARQRLEEATARYLAESRCTAATLRREAPGDPFYHSGGSLKFYVQIPCDTRLDDAGECKRANEHIVVVCQD